MSAFFQCFNDAIHERLTASCMALNGFFIYLYLHPIDHMGQPHLDIGIVNNIWYLHNMC